MDFWWENDKTPKELAPAKRALAISGKVSRFVGQRVPCTLVISGKEIQAEPIFGSNPLTEDQKKALGHMRYRPPRFYRPRIPLKLLDTIIKSGLFKHDCTLAPPGFHINWVYGVGFSFVMRGLGVSVMGAPNKTLAIAVPVGLITRFEHPKLESLRQYLTVESAAHLITKD
jgi:hypothetical protein